VELKYLQAALGSKQLGFVVTPEEEMSRLRGKHGFKIIDSYPLSESRSMALGEISDLVVTGSAIESSQVATMLCKAHLRGVQVIDLELFMFRYEHHVPADPQHLIRFLAMHGVHQSPGIKFYGKLKDLLESPIALLLLILLSPILAVAALLVKLTSPGPVIYSQERVGHRSRIFRIYKLRSMRMDAEVNGPVWASTFKNDCRLTPIGSFLRSSHLDELPQLWNVFRGDLSFIGPRPERPEFVQKIQESFPLFELRSLVKPGITGWAQIKQGYANSMSDSLRKLEFDLFYMARHSPWLDASIVFGTFSVLLSGGSEGLKRLEASSLTGKPMAQSIPDKPISKAS